MSDLKVISYNLDANPEAQKLIHSCTVYEYNLEFIGKGHGFRDFRQLKIDLLLEELGKVSEEYVMFTDGLDSWFLRRDAMRVFKTFKKPVVVSGNRDDYPATNLYTPKEYPEAPTSFRYICSSQFMGKTSDVIKVLSIIRDNYAGMTDQEGWNYCYAKGLIDVVVDHECRLFLNMTGVDPKELDEDFQLEETQRVPVSIHFGGPKGNDPNAINMAKLYDKWRLQHEN